MNSDNHEASPKIRFDILYSSLCGHYTKCLDIALKVAGLLFVVVGWLVTSTTVQNSLDEHPSLRVGGIGVVLLTGFSFDFVIRRLYTKSQELQSQLQKLNYLPRTYYADRILERRNVVRFRISAVVMTLGTCWVFWII
jgi:hypothetical protein